MLHERLKVLRTNKKITQQSLADMLGITEGAYRAYETGRSTPNPSALDMIAARLETTIDYLLGKTDNPMPLSTNEDIRFALHGVPHDLTEEEKQKVIEYAEFLKQQRQNSR